MRRLSLPVVGVLASILLLLAVGGCEALAPLTVPADGEGQSADAAGNGELVGGDIVGREESVPGDAARTDPEVWFETTADAPFVECEPGSGCFLDKCQGNGDCQSGWCAEHMGEAVCTKNCTEECPPGWECKQLPGTDVVYICVSAYSNLCKPCAASVECKAVGGADDVCVDYGTEGSFCGGACGAGAECPWGFTCLAALTVDGVQTSQCVADAGVCPCTGKSIELALWTPCALGNEWGECEGKRLCTAEGLLECSAETPAAEDCNGLDDDCDGDVDEPAEVGGDYVNLCDDANDCTTDICAGEGGCSHAALEDGECKDGNPCTVADHCVSGVCVGDPVNCDDENACTDNACTETGGCEYTSNEAECDDGNPCTVGDQCKEGECLGYQMPCECMEDADCAMLEDGDACTGTLFCETLQLPHVCSIVPGSVVQCPAPVGPDAPCVKAACAPDSGECLELPVNDGFPCEEGDLCSLGDSCFDGVCTAGAKVNCNDGNVCTDDSCVTGQGCVHAANQAACDDGNVCTVGDSCDGGACASGELMLCVDGNPCTSDLCDPDTGCKFEVVQGNCDDGNACTTDDDCVAGLCIFEGVEDCDDGNPCTTDSCHPSTGCSYSLNEGPCDDQDVCSTGDHCHLGECISSGTIGCNDNNVCTTDACVAGVGCVFTPEAAACDDGNACTLGDHCDGGLCAVVSMLDCDDGNSCTADGCNPGTGCTHEFNDAPCNDHDICTTVDTCSQGVCVGDGALDCDDGNTCTDETCDPGKGCLYSDNEGACSDENKCTTGDHCEEGSCVTTGLLECDDQNVCTNDNCDPLFGCVYSSNTQPCDDNDVCTQGDQCSAGLCEPGGAVVCVDDGNTCTVEGCDPVDGCGFEMAPDCCGNGVKEGNEECDDGNQQDGDSCSPDCLNLVFDVLVPGNTDLIVENFGLRVRCALWEGETCIDAQVLVPAETCNSYAHKDLWHINVFGNSSELRNCPNWCALATKGNTDYSVCQSGSGAVGGVYRSCAMSTNTQCTGNVYTWKTDYAGQNGNLHIYLGNCYPDYPKLRIRCSGW